MIPQQTGAWHGQWGKVRTPATVLTYKFLDAVVANACHQLLDSWRRGGAVYNEIPPDQASVASSLGALVRILDDHKPNDNGRCWTCQPPLSRSRTPGRCFLPRALYQALAQSDGQTFRALQRKAEQVAPATTGGSPSTADRQPVAVRMSKSRRR